MEEKKLFSQHEVTAIVMEYHYDACKIPIEFRHMITEIMTAHMSSLSQALGNLELCYRRMLDVKEVKE
jgi:hypothetical protein